MRGKIIFNCVCLAIENTTEEALTYIDDTISSALADAGVVLMEA
jgi:hypothetical protein